MRRECRCDSGEPCKCACVFLLLHARLRVHRAPGIPCALFIEGAKELKEFLQTSGAWRREIVDSCPVIASEAKQSSSRRVKGLDCFASLAMTGRESAISRRRAPEVCKKFSYAFNEGRRECRVLDAPAASRANKKRRTRTYQVHRNHTGIPCAMVLTAPPWSPWCTGLVSHPRLRELRPAN